jgi:beta-lactamase class A
MAPLPAHLSPEPSSSAADGPAPTTPEAAVTRLLSAPQADARWFAPSFLSKIPIEQIRSLVTDMRTHGGAFVSVTAGHEAMTTRFEHAHVATHAALDAQGRFTGILFEAMRFDVATVDDAMALLAKSSGEHSIYVSSDGKDRATVDADRALPVGSSFKLAVLATLRDQIDHKKRKWTDVVRLTDMHKTTGSGVLQTWPDGAPLTLYSLAASMISVSDNSAADTLVRLLGREAIEPLAPHARPFLTTREMFTLKAKENASLLEQWRAADDAGKRTLLDKVDALPVPLPTSFTGAPTALDVEWMFSTRELCALMERVHDLDVTSINAGLASRSEWDAVSYKGGSEAGVLNYTTWVKKGSHTHCVSATWREEKATLDDRTLGPLYATLLSALAAEDKAGAPGS